MIYSTHGKALELTWGFAGPVPGHCTNFDERTEPPEHQWSDNYLCSDVDIGLQFSLAGPIPGKSCVNLNEPSDPHTWADNFLCWNHPKVEIKFSIAGSIPDYTCVNINEPSDPDTWSDNYICLGFGGLRYFESEICKKSVQYFCQNNTSSCKESSGDCFGTTRAGDSYFLQIDNKVGLCECH